ncbi:MAG: GNAT family N-acetyltransferase [Chloroflexaceae bacterium]|jgi:RimJ/RimL family protein N-acetyltransferase|nr:GNAT family N-acetyltransferase [Chloroflexaceae bacterium]
MIIATSFGQIRPWHAGDATALVRYANNRNIWRNMRDGFPHPYTWEAARAFLTAVAAQSPTTFFAIATANEAIGGIGITIHSDVHRLTAELGYWLGEPFWGRGYITESIAAFTSYAFATFGLVRISAEPYATNQASARALEKAGYSYEGRLRCNVLKEGLILDQLLYAAIKPENLKR